MGMETCYGNADNPVELDSLVRYPSHRLNIQNTAELSPLFTVRPKINFDCSSQVSPISQDKNEHHETS